jgi:hypothetical protein
MKTLFSFIALITVLALVSSCRKKDDPTNLPENNRNTNMPSPTPTVARLYFTFKMDSTQARLDNLGQNSSIPAGHAAQSPLFNKISSHYIEMIQDQFTALGGGYIFYHAPETTLGGSNAIDFDSSKVVTPGEEFFSVPIKSITPGTYQYLRVSLSYQNYDIKFKYNNSVLLGTLASFVGFNTYIRSYTPKTAPITVNANKPQGYWGFETFGTTLQGQAPPGATTVPNPIFATSPIPQGSCLVTGQFAAPLTITGSETTDIHIVISLSTNKSFEWKDSNSPDGLFEPTAGDTVVDMGLRGLIPVVQ